MTEHRLDQISRAISRRTSLKAMAAAAAIAALAAAPQVALAGDRHLCVACSTDEQCISEKCGPEGVCSPKVNDNRCLDVNNHHNFTCQAGGNLNGEPACCNDAYTDCIRYRSL